MVLGYKTYQYENGFRVYFITINSMQFGPVHFSLKDINESMEKLKKGEPI